MRLSSAYALQILVVSISAQLLFPRKLSRPDKQTPLVIMDPVGPAMPPSDDPSRGQPPSRGGVLISDVMGRDRSVNAFAGFARDVAAVSRRLDSASENSTVLAPLNSAVDALPRKPWEDPRDYGARGASAYEGDDGRERARANVRRFVEAHVVPVSPWREGERARSLLDGDREIWWERKDGVMTLQPDGIEIQSVASTVGNGEVWIIKSVRSYS
ncbi:putative FAS1 domain-containing protein [Rosellinia necatrix]|uniref:Putative FAS1 domain-containing protein n=1 Tax=Rosellinia necatrix TaxID=77044 RepID=A0A1W2TKE0_ROSNE|nr:putative FAS1 domain-containing protein [Rosellinia necatrix]